MYFKIQISNEINSLTGSNTNEDEAKAFLEQYNEEYGALLNKYTKASWNYETNITDENDHILVEIKSSSNQIKISNEHVLLNF